MPLAYFSEVSVNEGAEEVQEHEHFQIWRRVLKAETGRPGVRSHPVCGSFVFHLGTESIGLTRLASSPGAGPAGAAIHAADSRSD